MSIIQAFKAAGAPKTAAFVKQLHFTSWTIDQIRAACLFAVENDFPALFDWAYSQISGVPNIQKDVLALSSRWGFAFAVERVYTHFAAPNVNPKNLLATAARFGHGDFLNAMSKVKYFTASDQEWIVKNAATGGQIALMEDKALAPAKLSSPLLNSMYTLAAQHGQLDFMRWMENKEILPAQWTKAYWKDFVHEAVSTAQDDVLRHLLISPFWVKTRKEALKSAGCCVLVQEMKTALRMSQNPEKSQRILEILVDEVSSNRWEKNRAYLSADQQECIDALYAHRQKARLLECVSSPPSLSPRRKI